MKIKHKTMTVVNAKVWCCHSDNLSIVIVELSDDKLLASIEEDESFNIIVGGIVELLDRELLENVLLSFIKHYSKSTYNVVLSDNKIFLANHVSKEYTNNMVKMSLLRHVFQGHNMCIIAQGTELSFEMGEDITESPAHLAIFYNKQSE